MDYDFISERISQLRLQKNVSAREMSLAIGQNPSYINRIENQKTLPSMQCFLYICEYLQITPQEFFDDNTSYPKKINELMTECQKLSGAHLDILIAMAKALHQK